MRTADLEKVSSELADALLHHLQLEGGLEDEMLEGAWDIGLATQGGAGSDLLREVIARTSEQRDSPLLRRIISGADQVPASLRERLGPRMATLLTEAPNDAARSLASLSEGAGIELVGRASEPLEARYQRLVAEQSADETPESVEERRALGERAIEALGTSIDELADGQPAVAEHLALCALDAFGVDGRDQVQRLLPRLSPVRTITRRALRMAVARAMNKRVPWLEALDEGIARQVDSGAALRRVPHQLWTDVGAGKVSEDDATAIASALDRLRPDHTWGEQLDVAEILPTQEDDSFEALERTLALADPLADIGLVSADGIAAARVAGAARELRRNRTAEQDNVATTRFVDETLRATAGDVSDAAFLDAWDALLNAQWLDSLDEHKLRLHMTVVAATRRLEIDGGVDAEQVLSSVQDYGERISADVAGWIEVDPGNGAIWSVIDAYGPRPPSEVLRAIRQVSDRASPQRRLELSKPALDLRVDKRLLATLGFPDSDEPGAAEELVGRFEAATNNRQRERVLDQWRVLDPAEEAPRKRLILGVLVRMATLNAEALELVLGALALAQNPPRGSKGPLRDALRASGELFDREKKVRKQLEGLGWSRRTGRFARRDEDVDSTDD